MSGFNSSEDQRQRILAALRKGPVSTLDARRDLDVMHPAARIGELRHRYGCGIITVNAERQSDCGAWHVVAVYVLTAEGEVRHA